MRIARYVEHVMGMPISLALRGRHADDERARSAWADVMAELHWVDLTFSTYREDSYVSRLGRAEIALADAPAEVAEVLEIGAAAERDSGGAFAVRRGQTFDPSGVVKGWAVERASAALKALTDTDFCLSAGGDMVCHSDTSPWRVGIEDPVSPSKILATVPVTNGGVATSGTAHRGSHLVDARTGRAPEGIASVTVIAASLIDADVDATTAYVLGREAAQWLRTRPGRTGLVVWADGSTTVIGAAV